LWKPAAADRDTGDLLITFRGGLALRVASAPDFEAWSANWPDGTTFVALPGGGLSRWGPQPSGD
jgi:hypothetical protein